ncbi:hypothetical protein PHMEG_00013269 [Phytophthora megakarya]|uniref:Uncharacterized protein n=1 Tax=Phytophthora megakarya TaxID=4795 RepID=A0A225W9A0_9STRA|nr:hypothetical protein PHMEG_00013269 [Phytophthora megakarya]
MSLGFEDMLRKHLWIWIDDILFGVAVCTAVVKSATIRIAFKASTSYLFHLLLLTCNGSSVRLGGL